MKVTEYKLVIIGSSGVGKTSYINRLLGYDFSPIYNKTCGVKIYQYFININDNSIKFNIWDTSGDEVFCNKNVYINGADCVIIMLSQNKHELKSLIKYINIIKQSSNNIPFLIMFNKMELDKTTTLYNLAKSLYHQEFNNIMLCSSKLNININESIYKLVNMLNN